VTVNFDFAQCSGVKENSNIKPLEIYPNPTQGFFTINTENGNHYRYLEVFNPQGVLVMKNDLSGLRAGFGKFQIDLSGYPRGIYFLRATSDKYIQFQKIIIE
jgi:hypothetical protein